MGGEQGISYLPDRKTFAKNVQRRRNYEMDCPPIPREWNKMTVPDSLKKCSNGDDFLLLEHSVDPDDEDSPKILGFCSEHGKSILKNSRAWFCDGTFDICK